MKSDFGKPPQRKDDILKMKHNKRKRAAAMSQLSQSVTQNNHLQQESKMDKNGDTVNFEVGNPNLRGSQKTTKQTKISMIDSISKKYNRGNKLSGSPSS
jgi:hypothetical protein